MEHAGFARGLRARLPLLVLAALAYVPALASSPGRMPADSKLYLYLDPGRLLGDAATTFDPRQFAGWVPHQHIAYLWPAGPWFWLFDTLGLPDWIAHRLWIGTLLVAAGLGVRWCARLLGLSAAGALAAALVYQLSPYLLPYVSRTSVMLLPWAGLGWIVGLTVRATRRADHPSRWARWADPALLALVVVTVGAVNATALAMIVPAPVLWLVHAVWSRELRWRPAVATAARAAVLSIGVSLWWAVMLVIQGRHGADVLPYSESLADVSFTATAPEAWRSLGYWLFYVRDRFGPTTSSALPYLSSSPRLLLSYAIPIIALIALIGVRWVHRRFAALLVAAGLVLAVGVHPIDDRAPLMRLLTGDGDEGLALALRSSTRAVPVAVLGLALLIGAAVHASATIRPSDALGRQRSLPRDWIAAGLVGLLALANLPSLWQADLVDPVLARDQHPPAAWAAAAGDLDDPNGRVLQVPGLEFGAFRWGYTVDQPLAGMADSPLVTRDLLPLGSPQTMDLLYAFDDRIQDGVLEPAALAPLARLLGATAVWLTNDAAYDRFDVTAPALMRQWLDAADGVGTPSAYGPLTPNQPVIEMADARYLGDPTVAEPAPPVAVYPVEGSPGIARAAAGTLVVSGSGDGVVDAAGAGLLPDGTALVYSAAENDDLAGLLERSAGLLVTDSNRARARHWRSSQDTTGFTESAGRDGAAPTELTEPAVGDARLPVFAAGGEPVDPSTQTTAEQRGPVIARASSYGQPFALQPEHRPYMAVDGDPATAWIVGEHGDPFGATFTAELTGATLPTALTVTQHAAGYQPRQITRMSLQPLDERGEPIGTRLPVDMLPASAGPTAVALDLPAGTRALQATLDAVGGGRPDTAGVVAGVGFAEFDLGLGPTREVVRVPDDALVVVAPDTPLTFAFTRLRADPADRWRDDPERTLIREFDLPQAREFTVATTVRLDPRAPDAELARLLGWPAAASTRLLGRPEHAGPAAIDGDPTTSWITRFDGAQGATLQIDAVSAPISELTVTQPVDGYTQITELTLAVGAEQRTVPLIADAAGAARAIVDPPLPAGPLTLAISAIEPAYTHDRRFGDRFELPAAITEIDVAGLPTLPDYRTPTALTECVTLATIDGTPLTAALTTGEPDGAPRWLGTTDLVALTCAPPRGASLELAAGSHLLAASDPGVPVQLDRVVLAQPFADPPAAPTVVLGEHTARDRTLDVSGCPDGCWVILGEGYNDAWQASIGGSDLGPPTMLDGGFTGWWVADDVAGEGTFTLNAHWTAQRPLTVAYVISALFVAGCITLVAAWHRSSRRTDLGVGAADPWLAPVFEPVAATSDVAGVRLGARSPTVRPDTRRLVVIGVVWVVAGFSLAGVAGLFGGVLGTIGVAVLRNRRIPELTAAASVIVMAGAVVLRERRLAPPPDGGWPHVFEGYHTLGMFAIACVVVAAVFADDTDPRVPSAP